MAVSGRSIVESLREVMQDLLVPELKAVKIAVDSLRNETKTSFDSLRNEMKLRDEKTEAVIRMGAEKSDQAIRNLSEKLDFAIDIRERLASLEARVPRH